MKVEVKSYHDDWQTIKDNAMFTIHKDTGKYPDYKWKESILVAEHSPIRSGRLIINCYDVPSFVIGHIVRHNIGFTPFVSSLRSDRYESEEVPNRYTPNNLRFDGNFQSFINISRKRLCHCASSETVEFWEQVLNAIEEVEPELYKVCVPECIYRCGCPEMKCCNDLIFAKFISSIDKKDLPKLFNPKYRYGEYHKWKDGKKHNTKLIKPQDIVGWYSE